ncbi:mRNA cleavage and polyadenylation factor subunit [Vanrija albida]|uniref:mRNA cleavage and polyadenylation factor subunit n=1 Tax=Vanrija albida TaxID=181172 RepID=A0ABR3PYN9_9TREE
MYALHSTLLPPSAIHHSLFLANFTPSTIYQLPKPHAAIDGPDVKVVGNLVVAGGQDLRVFEIREEARPVQDGANGVTGDDDVPMSEQPPLDDMGDSFFDSAPTDRAPVRYETTRRLHLLTRHQLQGEVTGLAPLRTIESSVDALDRLLVSFKDAKMAILEWSRGDIATVSLHTYERCTQVVTGSQQGYVPILRTDPLSRVAVLTLPEDSLAVLPVLQEQSELDIVQDSAFPSAFPKDVPYSPSFVLSLADVSPDIKNIEDVLFLPGFHSPTIAILFEPMQTWAGRYKSERDTFRLEIRTVDLSAGGSYPLLTSVKALPSDSLYLVACPTEIGGVVVVTTTGIIHVDQSGRIVGTAVNAWWEYVTKLKSEQSYESQKLSLEASKAVFVTDHDMLIVLENGSVHQVRFEMDGRAVGTIKIDQQSSTVPPPSSLIAAGPEAVFVASVEGDSLLAKVGKTRDVAAEPEEKKEEMEVDWDEDLYGKEDDANLNGKGGAASKAATGPVTVKLVTDDILSGIGRISDIEFGISVTDQGARTYPQLVALGGGSQGSTVNVFRRGIPITKKRRADQFSHATAAWFLPIQRPTTHKFKDIPESERTTIAFSSEVTHTRIFALSTRTTQDQIGRVAEPTVSAGAFFGRSSIIHVTPSQVVLLDSDAKLSQTIIAASPDLPPIVSASIADPYVVVKRADGSITLLVGDSLARTVTEATFPDGAAAPVSITAEVFTDTTGVYRTFEATRPKDELSNGTHKTPARATQRSRTQLTGEQIKRLQEAKPTIAVDAQTMESTMNASRGSQWLALLTDSGELQIRSLPDLTLVLQSNGVALSEASFTDDYAGELEQVDEDTDMVQQMIFCPVGTRTQRPHLLVLHHSGRLNVYEAQPRFTLDARDQSRRSLAVRFRKVHTQLLSTSAGSSLAYSIIPFENIEGLTGAFVTGEKPHWILSSDAHPVRSFGLKQAAYAFAKATHLGGKGEYFMRIEDGSFLCYMPPTLNTDFTLPVDRYKMERTYSRVTFDPQSGHYVGATALSVPFQAYDEEGEIQLGIEGENLIPPLNERSSLELFSAGSDPWRVVDGYDFDQNEEILCMESCTLESSSSPTGFRDFIVVGTGKNFGEDRASHGAVYVFEVMETVGEKDGISGWRLKFRAKDPTRNPVSALANINGYVVHSNGPKILAKGLDYDDRLMGLAFLDVSMYVTSIRVLKNMILVGDFVKSLVFAGFQENPYKFTTISRDLQDRSTVTADFLVHDGQVTFVTTDKAGDMRLLDFDPADPESINGERLMVQTEFHCGAAITASKAIARRKTAEEEIAPQSQLIYATSDGSLTTLVAVKPARFRRLQFVQDQLVRNAQHVAGLNPRAFRTVRNDLMARPLSKGVLDGGLLAHFAIQPIQRQRDMMRQIGTDAVTVASDLHALGGFW